MSSSVILTFSLYIDFILFETSIFKSNYLIYFNQFTHVLSRFHYDFFKKSYPTARLLFTDTDSLYYEVETEDIEKELFAHKELFDYSDYAVDSPYRDVTNKKVVGKFKCESKGAAITEFEGLRAKMYCLRYKESADPNSSIKEKRRIKGVSRQAARELRFEQYKAQLQTPTENYLTNRRIGTKLHQIYAISVSNFFKITSYLY